MLRSALVAGPLGALEFLGAGGAPAGCESGIQRAKGVRSSRLSMYQTRNFGSHRAPSCLAASFSWNGHRRLILMVRFSAPGRVGKCSYYCTRSACDTSEVCATLVRLEGVVPAAAAAWRWFDDLRPESGSRSASAALHLEPMDRTNSPFEIHIHGDVPLRPEVQFDQIQEALRPIWKYAGARSLADGARSSYEDEPGIKFDAPKHLLQMCWTVAGDEDFRQTLDEMCMNLNELAQTGAAIEVSFYDTEFDEDEEEQWAESRDDFNMLFVGPTPSAIMQVQRDLLVQDVVGMMERHFDGSELSGVVAEIDKLFAQRFDALVSSLDIGKRPRGSGGGHGGSGHGGGRKPRHLH